jgi:hypothetical protein
VTPDYEIIGMFIATWGMILPLYYFIGEVKSHIKSCPLCRKAIAEKELKEAKNDLTAFLKRLTKTNDAEGENQDEGKVKEHGLRSIKEITDSYRPGG